jgi:hypothetical protein
MNASTCPPFRLMGADAGSEPEADHGNSQALRVTDGSLDLDQTGVFVLRTSRARFDSFTEQWMLLVQVLLVASEERQ